MLQQIKVCSVQATSSQGASAAFTTLQEWYQNCASKTACVRVCEHQNHDVKIEVYHLLDLFNCSVTDANALTKANRNIPRSDGTESQLCRWLVPSFTLGQLETQSGFLAAVL